MMIYFLAVLSIQPLSLFHTEYNTVSGSTKVNVKLERVQQCNEPHPFVSVFHFNRQQLNASVPSET